MLHVGGSMEWIEFSDIIGIVIVIYVSVLAHTNHHIMKDVKLGFQFSGDRKSTRLELQSR